MLLCAICQSSFAFHELRDGKCISCLHREVTGNPLEPNAQREILHKLAAMIEERDDLKHQLAVKCDHLEKSVAASRLVQEGLKESLDAAKQREAKLREALQGVINSCVHPDVAVRAVMVNLEPIRAALQPDANQ